jgi:starch-binding outer membrane protein, SusD/RagB family
MRQDIYILIITVMVLLSGCNKLLEVNPVDKKTAGEYWKTEVDIEQATVGAYNKLQGTVWNLYAWSEVRGEITEILNTSKTDDLIKMNNQSIDQKNSLANWSTVYSAINCFNAVIQMAPHARQNDATFSKKDLNYYIGECKTLRALCYFYLARTFYQFPYTTQYSSTDQQNYFLSSINASQVMDSVISDLVSAESMVRTSIDYNVAPFNTSDSKLRAAYAKGRVTTPVVWAILTDVYLTTNNYAKALEYASKIVYDHIGMPGAYDFVINNWHTIFDTKNTSEGIFELQFIQANYNNAGDFTKWFSPNGDRKFLNRMNPNTYTYKYWEGDNYQNIITVDKRGAGGTYLLTNKLLIWKWAGGNDGSTLRDWGSLDANYIFYRYSDIYLMKAEALNRLGRSEEAAQLLLTIRKNAGYTNNTLSYSSVENLEEQILDERARELAFEGKRWYDLVRVAKRQKNYLVLAKRIADFKDYPVNQNVWIQKLSDSLSWYMPIYYTEIELNQNLHQNPYYQQNK